MSFQLKKVLITESVDPNCGNILKENGIEIVTKTGMLKEELLKEIATYDGLIVRSATKVTADVIEAGKQLCVIGRAGTGVDNIDCSAATRNGVLVLNAPMGNALSAAELTCGMVVSLSRKIPQACASLKSGKWDRKGFMGNELYGKTLAVIGLGRIGREVACRMQSFGMTTIGFDPLVPPEVSITFGVESMDLESIWPRADYITVHTPLIPQTKHLLNDEVFSKCKKGVKVVNCARGGIISEEALVRALESGQCGGAGLDVFVEEPPKDTALIQHPNVICTPHLGASTHDAQKKVAVEISEQFIDILNGKLVLGIVNSPTFCQSLAQDNCYWVSLCQSLGAILGTFISKTQKEINISISLNGSELSQKGNVLKVATQLGLLKQLKHNGANFVNTPTLAEEAHIKISCVNALNSGDTVIPNTVMITMVSGDVSHNVIGTVRGQESFLIAIDGVGFENPAKLSKNLIICRGEHGPKMTVQLLGSLVESGTVHSAHWSTIFDGRSWCIVNGDCSEEKAPKSLKNLVDFWAQLAL